MLGIVGSLAGLIKIRASQTLVDDSVFRLHYRWTTSLCFIACGLVATSDLVGSPIQCMMDGEEAPKPITTYCWISSTFTLNTTNAMGLSGHYESYNSNFHGLGNHRTNTQEHEKRVHTYYQWVPFMLFLMGCLFYLPHLIWKEIEGKRVESMLQGLNVISFDEANKAKKANLVKYLFESNGKLNGRYSFGYFFVQLLNMIIVFGVMLMLEKFFGGIFMDYGSNVVLYMMGHPEVVHNPMILAFPRLGKCIFSMFGPSGTIEVRDILCLLPQNIMNEKIFLVLWFWLIILSTVTCARIVYLAALFISPYLRLNAIERYGKVVSSGELENFLQKTNVGDFFLLATLANNLDAITFRDVIQDLIKMNRTPNSEGELEQPHNIFYPNVPSYRHFNIDDDENPEDYKKRMATAADDSFRADSRV